MTVSFTFISYYYYYDYCYFCLFFFSRKNDSQSGTSFNRVSLIETNKRNCHLKTRSFCMNNDIIVRGKYVKHNRLLFVCFIFIWMTVEQMLQLVKVHYFTSELKTKMVGNAYEHMTAYIRNSFNVWKTYSIKNVKYELFGSSKVRIFSFILFLLFCRWMWYVLEALVLMILCCLLVPLT